MYKNKLIINTVVIGFLITILGRWILVTGFGDYGTDYDFVSRLLQGQWQGKDFFSIFPPVPQYFLYFLMKIFGDNLFIVNINLWFWWLINIFAAYLIMLKLKLKIESIGLGTILVASLTVPINMHGVAFAYMASAFSCLALLLVLKNNKNITLFFSGFLLGIAILSKPNVGLIMLVSIFLFKFLEEDWSAIRKIFIYKMIFLLIGITISVFLLILFPGYHGGFFELYREVISGGSEIKGGLISLALRSIPRIGIMDGTPHRYLYEIILTLFISIILILKINKHSENILNKNSSSVNFSFIIFYAFTLFINFITLFKWDYSKNITLLIYNLGLTSASFFLWQVLYIFVFYSLIIAIIKTLLIYKFTIVKNFKFLILFITLIYVVGVVSSGRHNITFASALFVPVLIYHFSIVGDRVNKWLVIIFLWTLAWCIAPNWKSTFAKLNKLPENTKFSGLYWPDGGAQLPGSYPIWSSSKVIEDLNIFFSKNINDYETVLWLVPGPGAAFGGSIYRFGIHGLSANNVSKWGESRLAKSLEYNKPNYVVVGDLEEWNNNTWVFMKKNVSLNWLEDNYNIIFEYKINNNYINIWKLKQ